MAEDLIERIGALADEARRSAVSPEAADAINAIVARLEGPVRLAISGKVKAGKSTLLNAIIGEGLAPTDAGECTRIVTWYSFSPRPYAELFLRDGSRVERPYVRAEGSLEVDLGEHAAEAIDHMEIGWPSSRLESVVLIDTPGIDSISTEVSARTHRAMSAESGRVPDADAVLYLLRHTHSSDIRFLESFHDEAVAEGTPVNAVGVLSRADEIGSARLDAMTVAERVARRYRAEPRLHRLCPVVVPVDGLLGHAAATLREDEYAAVVRIARAPEQEIIDLLLTADRLAHGDSSIPVPADERASLLDRLGLFGVRLSVELIRTGAVATSTALCARLAEISGLDHLRTVVLRQFDTRARVLKARSAVAGLRERFQQGDCADGDALLNRLEQITASAHEFEEVRVLLELRSGELSLTADREAELDLLMGGSGHDPGRRLGLADDVSTEELRSAALAALTTWQGVEQHPLSSRATQIAARAATRTIEGLLAG